jgi:hypothetical protein
MNKYPIRRAVQLAVVSALALLSMEFSSASAHENSEDHDSNHDGGRHLETVIQGVTVTGQNDVRGQPFYDWGPPYGPFHFPTVGVYDPNNTEPMHVDETTPDSALLSTIVDPTFLIVAGATPADVDPSWVNVPLRNIPVNIDFALVTKQAIPGTMETAVPIQQSQSEPSFPITLGQWMSARGTAKIVCDHDGADVMLDLRSLLPNRMYDVWATLGLPRDGSSNKFFPIPLGGVPNVFVTDKHGNAVFKRWINFCPMSPETTNRPVLTINVQWHGNEQNYGAITEPGFVHGLWLGVITFNHIQFPVNVALLKK